MTAAAPSATTAGQFLSAPQRVAVLLAALVSMALAMVIAVLRPFTSGSDLGYNLGLVGGSMMLVLLLYPLRKRWPLFDRFGTLAGWFRVHMICGIGGPFLVLYHSTFQLRSLNGTIAFWSMVIVMISGIVGRFIYLHAHATLDGHHATLKEMERYLEKRADSADHALDLAPRVREWLEAYGHRALSEERPAGKRLWRFLVAGWERDAILEKARREIRRKLRRHAKEQGWPREKYLTERRVINAIVADFVHAIDDTARYAEWARLLAWWHVAHLPLVVLLVASGVAHVVAVHLY